MAPTHRRGQFLVDTLRRSGLIVLFVLVAASDRLHLPREVERYAVLAAIPILVLVVVWEVRRDLQSYRRLKEVRSGGRWPLGEPYTIQLDPRGDGSRSWCNLEFTEDAVEFSHLSGAYEVPELGSGRLRIAPKDVSAVRVRATWIEIESGTLKFRVVPRSYADRERLLYELAVRCNDAMERGIDESAGPARKPASPAPPGDVEDLDRRMTGSGLASALAGPMDRGNPAPPRKSGLGNGLFIGPTDDAK